jgi:hypothetical protein
MIQKLKYWLRYSIFLLVFAITAGILLIHLFEYKRLKNLYADSLMQKDSLAVAVRTHNAGRIVNWREHPAGSFRKYYNNLGFGQYDSTAVQKKAGYRRILITGDSHTDGVVDVAENFCSLLQDTLSRMHGKTEVLNAGTGNYSFVNYRGVIKRNLFLKPDEFWVMVYPGNDFVENVMYDFHWYNPVQSVRQFRARLGWRYQYPVLYNNQSLTQVFYFSLYPGQKTKSLQQAFRSVDEIAAICQANGIKLRLILLTTDFDLDPAYRRRVQSACSFSDAEVMTNRWFAAQLTDYSLKKGIFVLDLHKQLQEVRESMFYPVDHHLNPFGNRIVAQKLLPLILQ